MGHLQQVDYSMEYLQEKGVYSLVDLLAAQIFFYKPEDPKAFLIEQLESIQRLRQSGSGGNAPSLFNDNDIESMFSMFSKNMETITIPQAKSALEAIGIFTPVSFDKQSYNKDEFIQLIKEQVQIRDQAILQ
ncbi:hypothetical protein BLNAU_19174 [Blattamonas nauphoetae]|uniref:Uncharacterized protein n=1 Tax=Blattamonas nauphoetae TaxID=2049346 RepID=A0ABQ9X286_9EUKA|nr:hypothetical protein BLNAU_19174 [Blattamonas nauphoetae]